VIVSLDPMTQDEYTAWAEHLVAVYAQDVHLASGQNLDAVIAQTREQFPTWLPEGLATPDSWLFTVRSQDARVGNLWLIRRPDRPEVGVVNDVEIFEPYRGQGLGRATMLAAEQVFAGQGCIEVSLSVFGFNTAARHLYDSLGYEPVRTLMRKPLRNDVGQQTQPQ